MRQDLRFIHHLFDDLFYPVLILAVTYGITVAVRAILSRLTKNGVWRIVHELGPCISDVVLVLGVRMAAEAAPLSGRVETWVDGSIYVIGVFVILKFIQKAALLGIEWGAFKDYASKTLELGFIPLLRNVLTLFIFLTGTIMILKHFNYDVMSLLTALGVGSLAVGLAAKDTLSNMISGFTLIIDKNLRPGDRVNLADSIGDVEEIGLRSTRIKMTDGNMLIVPNSDLVNTKILNLSMPNLECACSTQVRIPYSVQFGTFKEDCLSIVKHLQGVSSSKQPSVNLVSLADGGQLIQIGFWVTDTKKTSAILSEFNDQLLQYLKQKNVTPVPAGIFVVTPKNT